MIATPTRHNRKADVSSCAATPVNVRKVARLGTCAIFKRQHDKLRSPLVVLTAWRLTLGGEAASVVVTNREGSQCQSPSAWA